MTARLQALGPGDGGSTETGGQLPQFFGSLSIHALEREVRQNGQPVPLGARAFDVLLALLARRDRVVSKKELMDVVWPGQFVEENNLTVQVSALRKALGAKAITTVTGRGYRWALAPDTLTPLPEVHDSAPDRLRGLPRRLVAVVAAGIVDWRARLAERPEDASAAWHALREEGVRPLLPAYGGRVQELTPEAILCTFGSTVDAVHWVLAVQRHAVALGVRLAAAVHADDFVIDDDRLLGEGLHLPQRWLALAEGAALLASPVAHALVGDKSPARWVELPDATPEGGALWRASVEPPPLTLRAVEANGSGPSLRLAVLPFDSGDNEDERYYGEGITEEIIGALSPNRGLMVIARGSTLRFRGTLLPLDVVAAELGVRYLLTGSVRRHQKRIRIQVTLVDAPQHRTMWSERFEGAESELFAIQQQIAEQIAGAIDPHLLRAEIVRAASVPTGQMDAYDCVLRALAGMHQFDQDTFQASGRWLHRALALDPGYARAHAHLAWWHNVRIGERRALDQRDDVELAIEHARQAVLLDDHDSYGLAIAGHIHAFVHRDYDTASALFERALAHDPNCAHAWAYSAGTLSYLGHAEEALVRLERARQLSPFDPRSFVHQTLAGLAEFVLGHYSEAVAWCAQSQRSNARFRAGRRIGLAALALSGELEEARAKGAEFMADDPTFRVSEFGAWYPLIEPHRSRLLEGLRLAGLPE